MQGSVKCALGNNFLNDCFDQDYHLEFVLKNEIEIVVTTINAT